MLRWFDKCVKAAPATTRTKTLDDQPTIRIFSIRSLVRFL